jgi:hypothetical protein
MRIGFVGHEFHIKSRSSLFFIKILQGIGEVRETYFSPDNPDGPTEAELASTIVSEAYDLVIFWQTEGIASHCLPFMCRNMVIIPMYDAAAGRSTAFWRQFFTCRFISFSRRLHETLCEAGLDSNYFQYFPEAIVPPEIPVSALRKGFFWERRPRDTLNLRLVAKQCKVLGIKSLHVHLAADFRKDKTLQKNVLEFIDQSDLEISFSEWFENISDLEETIKAAQFYFTPRQVEGIGMAFLEAMSRGKVVISPDSATMNDYIGHLSSGILYDSDLPFDLPTLRDEEILRLQSGAYNRCRIGRQDWENDIARLRSLILNDGQRWPERDYSSHFNRDCRRFAHEATFNDSGLTHRGSIEFYGR